MLAKMIIYKRKVIIIKKTEEEITDKRINKIFLR